MAENSAWKHTQATVTARLEQEEPLKAIFSAFVPAPAEASALMPVGLLPLSWAVSHAMWQASVRKFGRAAGVPMARRMTMAATSRRLIIWKADRRWRLREFLGELPLGRIGDIDVSGSGSRSRLVTLHLKTGGDVPLKLQPEPANWLRAYLA